MTDPDFEAHFDPEDFLEDLCDPYDIVEWDYDYYDPMMFDDDSRKVCAVDVSFLE